MDFVLGILTGVVLCVAYGHYVNNQRKKEEREQTKQVLKVMFGQVKPGSNDPLQQQLDDAVARDDFEEAARLRDLINKK